MVDKSTNTIEYNLFTLKVRGQNLTSYDAMMIQNFAVALFKIGLLCQLHGDISNPLGITLVSILTNCNNVKFFVTVVSK